jgi:hypothetical protein
MVSYVLPFVMVEVREYLDRGGRSPFAAWSDGLNREAAAKVVAALARASSKAICPTPRASGPVFMSTGLTLVRATGFTSAKMANAL